MSDWQDPLDLPMAEIAGSFGPRVPRSDAGPVEGLANRLAIPRPRLTVVVIGSNGKTSTATYLSDLFIAAGCRTGLFTSPHIAYWTERVRVDDVPVAGAELVAAVTEVNELAQQVYDERFRFFDVLTLAAARLFSSAGVDVAVYEAGIGGRGDATRALRPDLVVLSAVAREHTRLLGETEEEILRTKLDVAPPGSTVFAGALPEYLLAVARDRAAENGADLIEPGSNGEAPAGMPEYLARNWSLARSAAAFAIARLGGSAGGEAQPRPVYGRFTPILRDGVEYVVDVAHNPQAWAAFLAELANRLGDRRATGVVSVTTERPLDEFAAVVAASGLFGTVYATTTSVRPTHEPDSVAAALREAGQQATGAAQPAAAFARATAKGGTVAIFGSTYVVTDAMLWLDQPPPRS